MKKISRQMTFGELQGEVPGMLDETPVDLEESLRQTRQGPTPGRQWQGQPARYIAEIAGDYPREQPDLIGPKAVALEPGPVGNFLGFLAFLDPLFRRPTLVVEMDDGPGRPSQRGDDGAGPGERVPAMMLDLGDHPARPTP
jgi:hypothetical protein